MAWTRLASFFQLPVGELIEVEHDGELYALCNDTGQIRCISGVCPHEGGPLGQGNLMEGLIICPWHMWEFDSRDGKCLVDEGMSVKAFPVKVESGEILVDIGNA